MTHLIDALKELLGPTGFCENPDINVKNYKDIMGSRAIPPQLHLRPDSTEQISAVLKLCHAHNQPVVPQGGMTGLVSAAAPLENEITLSLERLNSIIEVDPYSSTITVEAGVPLQLVQEAADKHNLLFPLDLGARGSCTIGGNLATNAGGNRVIRYGMMRDLVIGLEAVLADGTVINEMHKLRKNNTGYDLKQLFIGSEGTLGVITKAVLKLFPKPSSQVVAFCALNDFSQVTNFLVHMQAKLGGNLTAFEVLWHNAYALLQEHVSRVQLPFTTPSPFYVLVESMGTSGESDKALFNSALENAIEAGIITDAVVSHSDKDISKLWEIRDGVTEIPAGVGRMHAYDVSLAITDMDYFGKEVVKRLSAPWPNAVIALFGHIGDGNLHILVNVGEATKKLHHEIDEAIYALISELKGAISAEHGIGIMKREFLSCSRSAEEIQLMKLLKSSLDPKGILSPGRIIEIE